MQMCYAVVLFVLNICACALGKEIEAHGSPLIRGLRLALQKRSRSSYDGHQSESRNDCPFENSPPRRNTIIKSTASIDNGAKYLNHKNGTSSFECYNLCCNDPTCDTSIYEDKGNHRCYMFHCNGLCKFKDHSGYIVWTIDRQAQTPPPKEEEEELAHLHKISNSDNSGRIDDSEDNDDDGGDDKHRSRSGDKNSDEDSGNSRTDDDKINHDKTGSSTYEHKPKPTYNVAPHTAGLSDFCDSDASCEDPNAGCFGQTCRCKKGFYSKNGLCREVCAQSDFECFTLGTSGRGPECIPKSNICDSYMQCADGSDEYNCPSRSQDPGRNPQPAPSSWMTGQGVPIRDGNNYDGSTYNNMGSGSTGRQIPVGTQPVLQEGQPLQHHSLPPSLDSQFDDKAMTQPKILGTGYNTNINNNDNNALPNSHPNPQNAYHNEGASSMDPPHPSVRPIHPALSQPANPSMNHQDQMPQTKHNNNNNNDIQHVPSSYQNTNLNIAYPKPTNIANKIHDNNGPKYNQNSAVRGRPSQDTSFTDNPHYQNINAHSDSFPGGQSGQPQHQHPEASQPREQTNPRESIIQHHNTPSQGTYSESGRLPTDSMGNMNSESMQNTREDNSKSSHSPTALHASDSSRESKGRDGVKVPLPNSPKHRIMASSKSPLPSSSKSSASAHGQTKSQQNLVQSSKSKGAPTGTQSDVRPNSYPPSSLLSSSSSRQQPSRQSWLDGNPYLAYGSNNANQRQRQQQMQPSRNSQYYDPSQYFSQYNTDSLDSLPPSLLGDTAPQDDFSSQFGSPYMDRQKPLNRMPYPMSGGVNSGYMGYPDSPYNSQYNQPSRYNYGGSEFGEGTGNYQDTDFYSSLRNPNKEYQSPGSYEEEQSSHQVPSSSVIKTKGQYPTGLKASTDVDIHQDIQQPKSTSSSEGKGDNMIGIQNTKPSPIPVPNEKVNATASSHEPSIAESVKNKTKQSNDFSGSGSGPRKDLTHSTTKKPNTLHKDSSNSKVFVAHEKVIIASSTSEAEGPIIALSLGLAFTLILIGLLACRLRNMKHRLRKGRPLNSNEADYLINGMYL